MITWFILVLLFAFIIYKRTRPMGNIEGPPLGLPRGTIRAIITILIVSYPLQAIIMRQEIPGEIISALLIVVAFYFEARKPGDDRLKRIVKELRNPEKHRVEERKNIKPLYLPKYTVRLIIVSLLGLILALNPFITDASGIAGELNTIVNIILIIGLYMIGSIFRGIGVRRERKKIRVQMAQMKDQGKISKYQIIETLMEEKLSWVEKKGKSLISLFILVSIIISLALYTAELKTFFVIDTSTYNLTFQGLLLLLINLYYGIRD